MTQIKGTNVASPVVPFDTADQNPSHEARYGKGGYRTVATTTERDAIPAPRREAGMLVYVAASGGSLWQLGSDLTTWTAFETGGGAPDAHAASHGAAGSDPVTIAGSQISGGALPSSATLTFSDGTSDAEIGGWGFGVELTADNAVYATVEPSAVHVHSATSYASLQASSVYFGNGTSLAVGTFDIGLSGYNGISLNCAVGVELNWQAGHLKATTDAGVTAANILCDSPIEFPGEGADNVQIDATGITFADGSQQTAAYEGPTVIAVADYASLPATGDNDKVYLTRDTGQLWWWDGSNSPGWFRTGETYLGELLVGNDGASSVRFAADDSVQTTAWTGSVDWANVTSQPTLFDGDYASLTSVPSTFAPSAHKTSHATGGSDALTPSDIGAASALHAHSAADVTSGTFDIARIPTGTSSTTVSLGNHTHSQLHDRSHAITSTSDHTAGNWKVIYTNGSGQVVELALGASGTVLQSNGASSAPSFAAVSGESFHPFLLAGM